LTSWKKAKTSFVNETNGEVEKEVDKDLVTTDNREDTSGV